MKSNILNYFPCPPSVNRHHYAFFTSLSGSKKSPYSPHGRLLEILKGGGGSLLKLLKESMKINWNIQGGGVQAIKASLPPPPLPPRKLFWFGCFQEEHILVMCSSRKYPYSMEGFLFCMRLPPGTFILFF